MTSIRTVKDLFAFRPRISSQRLRAARHIKARSRFKGKPRLTLVVAVAENGIIGRDRHLACGCETLKHFRRLTLGNTVLMGRKTFESLGKPLGRPRQLGAEPRSGVCAGARAGVSRSRYGAEGYCRRRVLVIGGASCTARPCRWLALELTQVHAQVEGDTRFPHYDAAQWRETARVDHARRAHAHAYSS